MKLIVKVLNGEECLVHATPEMTILEVKQEVQKILKVPAPYQKLLQLGRTLLDDKAISFYQNIKDGSKLTLVVKKPDPLVEVIFRCFRKYYTEQQSEKLTKEFMLDFEKMLKQFSLDDLERIAARQLTRGADEE